MTTSEVTKMEQPGLTKVEGIRHFTPALLGGNALWVLLLNVGLVGVFQVLSRNGAFLNPANVNSILISYSQVLLLVFAQTMLLGAGQIDLSQGSTVVLSSVVSGMTLISVSQGGDPGAAMTLPILIAVVIAVGAAVGLINGLLVGWLRINSLVATLGMLGILLGAAQVITKGDNLFGVPLSIQSHFGMASLFGIPMPTVTSAAIVGLLWLHFRQGRFGIHTIAIGSSERAAVRNGISRTKHLVLLYTVAGALCGIAGAFDLARFTTTDIGGHTNDALASISGAVIGGTSLFGGQPYFFGAVLGAMLGLILQSGLVILNFPPFYQTIAIGMILIIAVAVDSLKSQNAAR
ncbi:ABC transporter permease [Bradyrhizobium jicamae]|uniref:ABC transporter permease n=1 Tax=Bradyrhizobium jicamae TaxID=280332 RepID=UPI001BADD4E3|nr:ABC transporter permease [Bradyrhizobium jicamae]MBR0936049.1 ABC transporter permease [Bradyrhizobium jicamae]